MKVRCIKIENPITHKSQVNSPWLDIGTEYIVLGVLAKTDGTVLLRLVGKDGLTPALFDLIQFEIVNPFLPANWIIAPLLKGGVEITFASWAKAGFWERYFDGDADAVESFKEGRRVVELED